MHNLLTRSCIQVRMHDGEQRRIDLPRTLRLMAADRVAAFPALRAHQAHAWHALLVQLAALACAKGRLTKIPERRAAWEDLLRSLTGRWLDDGPWHLVAIDEATPAFLQPARHTDATSAPKLKRTPDTIDTLVASKNHDIKQEGMAEADLDDWLFALTATQTGGGYIGTGHYGVSRMNSGYSSRCCVGLRPAEGGIGAWFAHDVGRLLEEWREKPPAAKPRSGITWTEPWDGERQLKLDDLHPGYIETCRRIRLVLAGERIEAQWWTAGRQRVDAKKRRGVVGDHWLPCRADGTKSLTIGDKGFTYAGLCEILGPEFAVHGAMRIGEARGRWRIAARGMRRGQGKTSGYHERTDIVIGRKLALRLGSAEGREEVHADAKALLECAQATGKGLHTAMWILSTGGEAGASTKETSRECQRRLEERVDERFFVALDELGESAKNDRARVIDKFAQTLAGCAREVLRNALHRIGSSGRRRHLRRIRAQGALESALRQGTNGRDGAGK